MKFRPNVEFFKGSKENLVKSLIVIMESNVFILFSFFTVKLGIKELFDKEQIGIKEPFPVTNLPFT